MNFICFTRILSLILFISSTKAFSQEDSLLNAIEIAKHDSDIVKAYTGLGELFAYNEPEKADSFWVIAEAKCKNLLEKEPNNKRYKLLAYIIDNNQGAVLFNNGNTLQALELFQQLLPRAIELDDKESISNCYNSLGLLYQYTGNMSKALDSYSKSLKLAEEIKNNDLISFCYGNLSSIWKQQKQYDKALEYVNKSLELCIDLKDELKEAQAYNNIATIYSSMNKKQEAFYFIIKVITYTKSLEI